MIALIVLMGDDVFEAYEFRLLDIMESFDGEELRRKDVRMVEKERDWKREGRIFADTSLDETCCEEGCVFDEAGES